MDKFSRLHTQTISDSSHLHHQLTLSLSHQKSVKMFNKKIEKRLVEHDLIDNIGFLTFTSFTNSFSLTSDFCTNKGENDGKTALIDITGNVHSFPCTHTDCPSVEHWKQIQGNHYILWDFILTNIIHRSHLHHLLNCPSLFCHQISVKSRKRSLVATSEVIYICNNFIPHLLFCVTPFSFST